MHANRSVGVRNSALRYTRNDKLGLRARVTPVHNIAGASENLFWICFAGSVYLYKRIVQAIRAVDKSGRTRHFHTTLIQCLSAVMDYAWAVIR